MNKDNYVGFITHTIDNNQTELYEERNAINQTSTFTTTDGVTDTGELKTLSERGVTSLTLNTTTPYTQTTEETNTIIEETSFTDASGEGVMRDVLFSYENTSKPTDGVYFDMDGNGIKEKMTTWNDPNQWMIVENNIWIESKNTRNAA